MRVTVVGSRGFLARALIERLERNGCDVEGLSSSSPGGIDPATGLLPADFSLRDDTRAVVYLAQSPFYRQAPDRVDHLFAVNSHSALRLAELARRAGVRRFIYASTGSVYAPSFQPLAEGAPVRRDRWYPLSKLHAEDALALLRGQLEVVCVRPFGIYGPGQSGMLVPNLLRSIVDGQEITVDRHPHVAADRDGLKISLCYVDDAAAAIERLLEVRDPPPVLNLAGRQPVSIRHIAESIGAALGIEPRLRQVDRIRETDLIADTTLLEKSLGAPSTDFETGLARTMAAGKPTALAGCS